jgi:hypothetical protein
MPGELKWYQFSLEGGAVLKQEAFACPDCGMVWTTVECLEILSEDIKRFAKPD